jgi:hypothetical protein
MKPELSAEPDRSGFAHGQRIVGTYYFYWYDFNTKEHFLNPDGTDALTDHPLNYNGMSYRSARWHEQQLRDVVAAGLDFILAGYWGYPGDYSQWSFVGIPPLVEAARKLADEGLSPPRIGLIYDTTTLQFNGKRIHVDLTTLEGKEWLYVSVRDFYSLVPKKFRASIDGRPIVWLYSAQFAKKQDVTAFDYLRREFKKDFGVEPFIVKDTSWQGRADLDYRWGAALGAQVNGVCGVGPGYDHSAVPGRKPLVRRRDDGDYYRQSWNELLSLDPLSRCKIAVIETWNEFHEATEIAPSKEYGRLYVDLTKRYADYWHAGVSVERGGKYVGAREVSTVLGESSISAGLELGSGEDGVTSVIVRRNLPGRFAGWKPGGANYFYFDVDDSFFWRDHNVLELEIEYLDAGTGRLVVDYDSAGSSSLPFNGAFKPINVGALNNTGAWKSAKVRIPDALFSGRTNGHDFRISGQGSGLALRKVVLRKVLYKYSPGDLYRTRH